ncbi:glycogen debranching protein GlgX [Kaistia dalseonensis]|uniref:Glycogen operon protein n=1 Tax=Kaistia dalseonensis TaxID=410840 RepID=A0ABU0H988_9HYPH|nr:glycogen debranching protein GlgX [Kaistia dalseonensis]MCX5495964.1 glycogen debranching protein GlgX [Kaistia dalseonensis]MDQ0438567.1 glycogen operon protein [Kaistia dalseonensis]
MSKLDVGSPFPLGAQPDDKGTNFALFSDHADGVTLCLFSADGSKETERIDLQECTNGVWHGHVGDVKAGQLYGYRVYGPWDPANGHRFNANKLLLDPYARELVGELKWDDALYGYTIGAEGEADLVLDERDSALFMPKARIISPEPFTRSKRPRTPWPQTVIYESHVRGWTMRHKLIPEDIRGTFAAFGHPAAIEHLQKLGVTTVEFLPIHAYVQDRHLLERGLSNFWGYNTIGFFAPESRYIDGGGLPEIAGAIDRLHEAGIEVILDVVYNHTAEGNHLGPTLSFKGIDNYSYYRLMPDDKRYYDDLTGTGNAVDTNHPRVLQMVLDSLRLWANVYGVDGFRFDLALTLGREPDGFNPRHAFFNAILQDPVLGQLKLIAEPWDVGPGGYQLGNFPAGFSEWNGDYRDVVREFWMGAEGLLPSFASRFAASSDLFNEGRRRPWSSVNFVTAHDGFTLEDLVSYNDKHNEANGEDNRDGADDNRSWNCGAEGPTDDPAILALRKRQKRNLIATLLLSQGVPMLLAGDELDNSQGGNNNAYCQDNEIGWVDWTRDDPELTAFVAKVIALRKGRSTFARAEFLTGARTKLGQRDVQWFGTGGARMTDQEWADPHVKCLAVRLAPTRKNEPAMLVMLNASHVDVDFVAPGLGGRWRAVLDTAEAAEGKTLVANGHWTMPGRSLVVWEQTGQA